MSNEDTIHIVFVSIMVINVLEYMIKLGYVDSELKEVA